VALNIGTWPNARLGEQTQIAPYDDDKIGTGLDTGKHETSIGLLEFIELLHFGY